ncbi:FMN hydrolase / 5-amino-6-(5-phospho-D-ribitylamino)uracil phosphatase [Thermoflexales bacterium]|nr:FMN hydrolase / 5-amino-6-(5-phospho-D-ribitylamino)uracil phosphatase [Thermoflexales bacterium]
MIIKAICFDADGVVVNPQMQFSKHLNEEYGISPKMTQGFFQGVFNDCLVGKANLEDVLPTFLAEWGWKGSVNEFIKTWLLTDHIVDSRITQLIRNLRWNGIICCLATSQEHHRAEYMKREMGFQEVFDHLFFSCEVGWQKPCPAYYQYIEKTLGLAKESILLWDDSRINIEAAQELGWNAEIYTEFADLEKTIKKYIAIENRA